MKKALLISCFDWYETRLKPIQKILERDYGYDVQVFLSDFDHIRKRKIERNCDCHYISVPTYKHNLSISRIRSHLTFGKAIKKLLERVHPNLVYTLLPPNNVAVQCVRYKKANPHTILILDIIDMWPESLPLNKLQNSKAVRYWQNMRDCSLPIADFIFTECDLYQDYLSYVLKNKKNVKTLYLFKQISETYKNAVCASIISKNVIPSEINLGYVGSINNIIDIESICNVLVWLCNNYQKVTVHIIGDGNSKDQFLKSVKSTGCYIRYYGKIFDDLKKIEILGKCDMAFNMMRSIAAVGLTIKSIDYFSMGLPIINNIRGDTWNLVEKYNLGVNIGNQNLNLSRIESLRNTNSHLNVLKYFYQYFTLEMFEEQVNESLQIALQGD